MNSGNRRMKRQILEQNICMSNATNSRSPDDLRSRIFIGNLNTSYAFIQYDDQMDAINAVLTQDQQVIAGQAIDVNLVTEPKPHQKSSKSSTVSNGSEMCGEMSVETENNSIENSVESEVNYNGFEHTLNDMAVESDQSVHSKEGQNCGSNSDTEHNNSLNVHMNEVQTKRVKLDFTPDVNSVTVMTNDISSKRCKNCENGSSQCSANDSSGRSDSIASNVDNYHNKYLTNSLDNCCHYLNEQNQTSIASLLSNPSLSSLLNSTQRLTQDSIGLSLAQVQQQSYDILICGNCRTFFTSLSLFIQHKRGSKCRLRFVCHCQQK